MIDVWESLLRTVSALAVVLVLMGIVALVARRLMGQRLGSTAERPLVRVLANSYIGPRKTIALVSVAGEYLIVGTTATDLVPLGRLSDSTELRELLTRSNDRPSTETAPLMQGVLTSWLRRLSRDVAAQQKGIHDQ